MALTPEQRAAFDEVRPDEVADRYSADHAVLDFERYCEREALSVPAAADVRVEIISRLAA